jgi:hypothetical protein
MMNSIEVLKALQARHRQLLAMLPDDLDDLDAGQLDAALADIELIATEMASINWQSSMD